MTAFPTTAPAPPALAGPCGPGTGRAGPGPVADDADDLTPLDRYRRAQQQMTPVEAFSRVHDAGGLPAQARWYRDLVPSRAPGTGEQYGFDVDLDACSGCKACVTACHSLNGLGAAESFRSVGALLAPTGAPDGGAWQQSVTTACHHCVDPACLTGCPVDAYEKDPVTGVVRHLDDQCIGCRYCTLTCPYEVPTFHDDLGIVRKCDLCTDRLAEGEAPACVQACPTSAIRVAVVDLDAATARAAVAGASLVPTAPGSAHTVPTTTYRSSRPVPADATPADHLSVEPGHAHPPLVAMLVLTQLAVGAFVAGLGARLFAPDRLAELLGPLAAGVGLVMAAVAMAASLLHLGRPRYAWRAVIGLGHSWLSREILAFSAFAGLAALDAVLLLLRPAGVPVVGATAGAVGLVAIWTSVMVYAATGRARWRAAVTGPKFLLTAAATGPAVLLVLTGAAVVVDDGLDPRTAAPLLVLVAASTAVKLAVDASELLPGRAVGYTERRRTAILLRDDLWPTTRLRLAAGLMGGLVGPALVWAFWAAPRPNATAALVVAALAASLVAVGELSERSTFFTALSSPRMPGALR